MKPLQLAALVAVFVAAPMLAQEQPRRPVPGPVQYLNAKSVQEEIKLSEDDAKKIVEAFNKLSPDLKPNERGEAIRKTLADNLKPDQLKRLNQIMWQRGGIQNSINHPDVRTALNLTDEQKQKVRSIQQETQKQMTELNKDAAGNREKIAELRKKTASDLTDTLTEEQRKAWKELLGEEFKGQIGRQRPNQGK